MDLNIIWFILIAVLLIGYIILDGFDMGVGMLHMTAKSDTERRIMINAIGPVWDGNEVWLITGGGALFAAFPHVYATVFSGFYSAFMLFLTVLIGRAVAIEFRSKVESPSWRKIWDWIFHVSSYLIALLLGVTLGNLITGIPVGPDMEFTGTFFGLLNPYAVFCGITAVLLIRLHGTIYMTMKTDGEFRDRFVSKITRTLIIYFVVSLGLHAWTIFQYPQVTENMMNTPIWFIFPVLIILSVILIPGFVKKQKFFTAFTFSSLIILSSISMVAVGIFPNMVISNPGIENSLTIYNAASSQGTLETMLIIALIGVPLVLSYTVVVYRVFRGKVEIGPSSY